MAETYTSKRISELQEATNLTNNDLFVINEFNSATGYTLTKKVRADVLYRKITEYVRDQLNIKSETFDNLKPLAHCDFIDLMLSCANHSNDARGENPNSDIHKYGKTLALSNYEDLLLGDLAKTSLDDLKLHLFALNGSSTCSVGVGQYMTRVSEVNGRIVEVGAGSLADAFPLDSSIDSSSQHAVQNSTIAAALGTKVDKATAVCNYVAPAGQFVTGIQQQEGKITQVKTDSIYSYLTTVDPALSRTSTNPVENRVITARLEEMQSSMEGSAAGMYVKKADANSSFAAPSGQYVNSITLTEGKIVNVTYANLPAATTVDGALSEYSANPVQNKVITPRITGIENNYVKKADANSTFTAGNRQYIYSITQTNGKLVDAKYRSLPTDNGMKYTGETLISRSGIVCNNVNLTIFTATYDCMVNFTVKLLINTGSCGTKTAREAYLKLGGTITVPIVTMSKAGDGVSNFPLLLKSGDQIVVTGYCGSSHGTQWSVTGSYLTRT